MYFHFNFNQKWEFIAKVPFIAEEYNLEIRCWCRLYIQHRTLYYTKRSAVYASSVLLQVFGIMYFLRMTFVLILSLIIISQKWIFIMFKFFSFLWADGWNFFSGCAFFLFEYLRRACLVIYLYRRIYNVLEFGVKGYDVTSPRLHI